MSQRGRADWARPRLKEIRQSLLMCQRGRADWARPPIYFSISSGILPGVQY